MNNFYIGVVEDRNDPLKRGRVRVRVLGVHSPDRKNDIQISDLPWSMVVQPANTPTAGATVSQLVEGTWVVVTYLDPNMQDPMVLGSIPSSQEQPPNYEEGFSDPFGVNPRWTGEGSNSDLSLVSDEDRWTEHPTYNQRKEQRQTEIPRAKAYPTPSVSSEVPDEKFDRTTFDEKDLRGGQDSLYPYNAVREFEAGHLEEYDSTPENERVTHSHKSGSYHEVLADGTTTVKIVGDGYSITLQDQNIYIAGDLNMTVDGSVRQLIKGDHITEVDGNKYEFVRGNRTAKIGSNDTAEIGADQAINILEKHSLHCGGNQTILVDSNHTETIGGTSDLIVRGDRSQTTTADSSIATTGSESIMTIGQRLVTTGGRHRLESVGNIELDTDGNLDQVISGSENTTLTAMNITAPSNVNVNGDVIADGISLVTHIHGGVTSGPSTTGVPQ